jgi:hypothetical protein
MIRALKWMTAIGIGLSVVGYILISMAIRAYPNSNLLGGWGLILGPIFWLGLLICIVAALAWIVVGLRAIIRTMTGGNKNSPGEK